MKKKVNILLNQTIRKLGHAGDKKSVAKGFYINYLKPRNLAIPFSEEKYKEMQANLNTLIDPTLITKANTEAKKIEGLYLYFERSNVIKANETEGILYGSITTKDICEELNNITGLSLTKDQIELDMTIKHTGIYKIFAILYNGISASFSISISSTIDEAKNLVAQKLKDEDILKAEENK